MELKLVTKQNFVEISNDVTQDNINAIPRTRNLRLLQLEGECKIKYIRLLTFDWIKTCLLIVPIVITFIPLLLLKYYISLRVKVFYKSSTQEQATYVFIEGTEGHEQIEPFLKQGEKMSFYFRKLKYSYQDGQFLPIGYQYEHNFQQISSRRHLTTGTTEVMRRENQTTFGKNEHKVQIPNYFQYLFDILTQPFFLMQYGICVIYIFENLLVYVYLQLGLSYVTTTVNYIILYISFRKIREMAEKQVQVTVIRDGERKTVMSHHLVPGDVVIPQGGQDVSYDGILVDGEVFVNEASLTGESIPVGKFPAENLQKTKLQNRWLFEGAKILQSREDSRVIVVNVGFGTRRGKIIRKIQTRVPHTPDFFKTAVYFLIETGIVGLILFLVTLPLMIGKVISVFIVYRMLDILGWSFPPAFPIFFNLSYSFSLMRLKWQGIMGNDPQKTTQASNIRTFCFDKTGTLTQNQIEVYEVIKFNNQNSHQHITDQKNDPSNNMIMKLFASCHTVRQVDGIFLGDEVDLRMFLFSGYTLQTSPQKHIRFVATSSQGDRLEVLRINQFESKFQNMSVLLHDTKFKKYYVFVKGAPERIDRNSTLKLRQFQNIVTSLSLQGFRTIAFGFKEISQAEVEKYSSGDREIFETNIKAMGLVAFENKLKEDTKETIQRLIESDIQPKMITGDNIFIAVETGYRSGILRPDEKVVIFQGRKQTTGDESNRIFQGLILQKDGDKITQTKKVIREDDEYINQNSFSYAIDNDFLSLTPQPQITNKIKLFARISPENKVKIVRLYKQQEKDNFQARSRSEKWFGPSQWKVGMCGDGANDLMAIREADVGVAISDSDASYGASFLITKMLQVDHIIRESKNTTQGIVDTIRYYGSISFLKLVTSILLVSDVTYYNANQTAYYNFGHSIFLAVFISLSSPGEAPTKRRPVCNMMSLENHVIYWANIILPTAGFCAAYFYFYNTSAYIANPLQTMSALKGYLGLKCTTNTIIFLLINIPLILNAFIIYNSLPFKRRFYTNILLMIVFVANLFPAIVFFFVTGLVTSGLGLVSIPNEQTGGVLGIMGFFMVVSYIFNHLFQKMFVE